MTRLRPHTRPGRLAAWTGAAIAGLLLAALIAPALAGRGNKPRQGSLSLFIVSSGTARAPSTIDLLGISAVGIDGDDTPLEVGLKQLNTAALAGGRHPLAGGAVPTGRYRGLRLVCTSTAGDVPPAPAGENGDSRPVTIEIPGEFRVGRSESVTLTVQFDPVESGDEAEWLTRSFRIRRKEPGVVRGLTLYVTDESEDKVVAINRDVDEVFAVIPVGDRPRGIEVAPGGRRVFVANAGDDTVSVIDPATHQVVDTVTLKSGCRPEDLAVGLEGRRLVVSCPGLNLLTVLDPLTNAGLGEVALARAPGRIVVGRDQRTLYALVPEGNQIVSADLLRPGGAVRSAAVKARPTDLAVDPLSGAVYVTHARAPVMSAFDAQLNPARQLQVGTFSHGIAVEADGRRVYASGGDAGGLALIGPQVGTVIRRWNAPAGLNIALDPDGRKVYMTGGSAGTLIVIDRIAGRVVRTVHVGKNATDLVLIP